MGLYKRILLTALPSLFVAGIVFAVQISVPSATQYGQLLRGNTNGNYTPVASSTIFQNASAINSGLLTSTDWNTFNNKQAAGAYLTTVTADSPLSGNGTSASHLTCPTCVTSIPNYDAFTHPFLAGSATTTTLLTASASSTGAVEGGGQGGVSIYTMGSGVGTIGFNSLGYAAGVTGYGTLMQLIPSTGEFDMFLESNAVAGAQHGHTTVLKWFNDGIITIPLGLISQASSTITGVLNANGGLSVLGTVTLPNTSVANAALQGSGAITFNTTAPITGGASTALGGSITFACASCLTSSNFNYDAFTHPIAGESATSTILNIAGFNTTASSTVKGFLNVVGNASTTQLSVSNTAYFPGSGIWNSSGNVGIGTTGPAQLLQLSSAQPDLIIGHTNTANYSRLVFRESSTEGAGLTFIGSTFSDSSRRNALEISSTINNTGFLSFQTQTSSAGIERMRITNNGNVGIGTSSPGYKLSVENASEGNTLQLYDTDGNCLIDPDSAGLTTTCTSDEKLKQNISDTSLDALKYFMDFRIRDYTMKTTGRPFRGVIAQELELTHPELVHDIVSTFNYNIQIGTDIEGNPIMETRESTSTSKFVTLPTIWDVIKALQQLVKALTGVFRTAPDAPTHVTGMTLYDTATNSPWCVQITNGVLTKVNGACN